MSVNYVCILAAALNQLKRQYSLYYAYGISVHFFPNNLSIYHPNLSMQDAKDLIGRLSKYSAGISVEESSVHCKIFNETFNSQKKQW